jgi:outer membrane protein OmpA-like peptidoglycan-associated protein
MLFKKSVFVMAIATFFSASVLAQGVQMPQQGQQEDIEVSDQEMKRFVKVSDKLQVVQQGAQKKMMKAIEDNGLDVQRYSEIEQASRSGQEVDMTAEEEKAYEVEEFFSLFVEKGMNDLNTFTDLLQKELESGKEVELAIRGFASPRAKTDYNEHLAKRRINSLVNYLKDFENGKLLPYFADTASSGGSLEIVQIPFGETKAASDVSDALQDEEESIYSVAASLERKIEITSVQPDTNKVEPTEINLGIVAPQKSVPFSHTLKNDFVRTMTIDSVIVSCDCISGSLPGDSIAAGDSLTFQFSFNSEEYRGEVLRQVLFYLNGNTEPRILKIRAFVRRED